MPERWSYWCETVWCSLTGSFTCCWLTRRRLSFFFRWGKCQIFSEVPLRLGKSVVSRFNDPSQRGHIHKFSRRLPRRVIRGRDWRAELKNRKKNEVQGWQRRVCVISTCVCSWVRHEAWEVKHTSCARTQIKASNTMYVCVCVCVFVHGMFWGNLKKTATELR